MKRTLWSLIPLAAALGASSAVDIGGGRGAAGAAPPPPGPGGAVGRLTLDRVARYPPPGTPAATGFLFGPGARSLYFLPAEPGSPTRVLMREEVATAARALLARAPRSGAREMTREETLRRERERIQDTGITHFSVATAADVVVFPSGGDLYLARAGEEPLRLTDTGAVEEDPQLSPDGTRVAYVREGDLFVLDIASRRERRLTEGARDGVTHGLAEYIAQEEMGRTSGYWWSPDGRSIACAEVDETRIPEYPIVHQGTPAPEVEIHRYPFAGGPNARVRLGVIAADGGPTRFIEGLTDLPDGYLARVRYAPDGSLLVQTQTRDQRTLRLWRIEPGTARAAPLLEETSDAWINLHDDLTPLSDGRFLWTSERGGWRHIELRRRDGSLERALTSGDWPVDAISGVDETEGQVYFTAGKDGALHRRVYRVALAGGDIAAAGGEPGFHDATFAEGSRVWVDVHDSAAAPPRALLRDGSTVARVLAPNDDPEARALRLPPPAFVTLRAADGAVLHGAIYRPPASAGKRFPALVRVYAGPTAQTVKDAWELTADLRAQFLAAHGYVVFRLDNRGTPRRGRRFETTLYRRLGTIEAEDQIAGARWLAKLPYVDPERIGIYGWSYGGYAALHCFAKAPDLFKAAVAGAPVTDWSGYDTHYTERYMSTPEENPAGYRESSVLPLAPSLRDGLLIVHGLVDENVHFRHTARLLAALNEAQRAPDLLLFPEERHLPRRQADRRHMEERLVRHFDRLLKRGK